MNKTLRFAGLALAALIGLNSCSDTVDEPMMPTTTTTVKGPDQIFWGLTNDSRLVRLNALDVTQAGATIPITNLFGDQIISIDFRPATGQLYGLGLSSRLYTINLANGRAQVIGTTSFTPAISGSIAMIDFNPTVDRVRLVTNSGQNLRLNPETGAVQATDGAINGASGASITGIAYTNSVSGAATTTLYDLDATSGKLYRQDPPNNGTLVEVGASTNGYTGSTGFDISPNNSVSITSVTRNNRTSIATLDLATGRETVLGNSPEVLRDIAIPTAQVAYAVDASNNLHIINNVAPNLVTKPITGMATGESVLGIDFRPLNGQLYALGSTSVIYTINVSTGAATAVGTALTTPLSGTKFGFDFNPTVDRIRIISNTGQNLRYNPNDNTVLVDGSLNGAGTAGTATAYSNNYPGGASTAMYVLNDNGFFQANPPNNGTLIRITTLPFTVNADNGFDIGGTSNLAFFVATTGTASSTLYNLDIGSGAATAVSAVPARITGFAIGLGF